MNLRNLFPAIALLLGIILGVLGAKSLSPSKEPSLAQPEGVRTKSTTGNGGGSVSSAPLALSLDGNVTLPGGPFTGSAEELLDLSGTPFSGVQSAEFVLTIESLSEGQVATLLKELETSHANDNRSWQARNALMRAMDQLESRSRACCCDGHPQF